MRENLARAAPAGQTEPFRFGPSGGMFNEMNTVHDRLRHLREAVLGLSLRDFRAAINARLEQEDELSLGTISNYERPPASGRRPGPRVEVLAALRSAFPEVRLDWVMFGEGQPTETAQRLASPEGLEAGRTSEFAERVLARYPDLELLSPEASALFMAALTRFAMGEPDAALDEDQILELAGDLRWILLLPVRMWGFRHAPPYDVFSDYSVALLHALMQLMPAATKGDPVGDYEDSRGPELRERVPVGFGPR